MKLGALLKMGAFLISGGIFDKVEENEMIGLGEGWPRKFLRCFVNGSGKRKKFFTKI
jgi:hypothetical protein